MMEYTVGKKVSVMAVNAQRYIDDRQIDLSAVGVAAKDYLREVLPFSPVEGDGGIGAVRHHNIEFVHIHFRKLAYSGTDVGDSAEDNIAICPGFVFKESDILSGVEFFPEISAEPDLAVFPVSSGGEAHIGSFAQLR